MLRPSRTASAVGAVGVVVAAAASARASFARIQRRPFPSRPWLQASPTRKPTRSRKAKRPRSSSTRPVVSRGRRAPSPAWTSRRSPPAWRWRGRSLRFDQRRAERQSAARGDGGGRRFRRPHARDSSIAQTEATVQPAAPQPEEPADAAPAPAQSEAAADESTSDSDKAARRRSTVREKVSFFSSQPEPAAEVAQTPTEVAPPAPAAEPAPEAAVETPAPQPRRAGWWSRRFGGGE